MYLQYKRILKQKQSSGCGEAMQHIINEYCQLNLREERLALSSNFNFNFIIWRSY